MMKRILCFSLVLTGCKSSQPPAPAIPVIVLGQDIDRTGSKDRGDSARKAATLQGDHHRLEPGRHRRERACL